MCLNFNFTQAVYFLVTVKVRDISEIYGDKVKISSEFHLPENKRERNRMVFFYVRALSRSKLPIWLRYLATKLEYPTVRKDIQPKMR